VESVILAASIFVSFTFGAAACLGFFFVFRKKHVRSVENILDSNLRSFSYQELQEATNGFTEELGRGAFGVVYKGTIQIGSGVQVAVKKLNCVIQDGEKEFKTELRVIGKTHHKNLVCLVGYCDEGEHRLLQASFLLIQNPVGRSELKLLVELPKDFCTCMKSAAPKSSIVI
ncbi:unnamed protein product, partial [Prunus brigantina]